MHTSSFHPVQHIDDKWFDEWVEYGMKELSVYLTKWAKFSQYLAQRKLA